MEVLIVFGILVFLFSAMMYTLFDIVRMNREYCNKMLYSNEAEPSNNTDYDESFESPDYGEVIDGECEEVNFEDVLAQNRLMVNLSNTSDKKTKQSQNKLLKHTVNRFLNTPSEKL